VTKTTISPKGQIIIPKVVRDRLKLTAGTQVSIDVQGETLVMKRLGSDFPDWHTMRGMFRGGPNLLQDLAAERSEEVARDHDRIKGR
jgi:AbrB family looped-hinge helix DNA binding protein